jgi:hypothetical protein
MKAFRLNILHATFLCSIALPAYASEGQCGCPADPPCPWACQGKHIVDGKCMSGYCNPTTIVPPGINMQIFNITPDQKKKIEGILKEH